MSTQICVFVVRTFETRCLSNFEMYCALLFNIFSMLCVRYNFFLLSD